MIEKMLQGTSFWPFYWVARHQSNQKGIQVRIQVLGRGWLLGGGHWSVLCVSLLILGFLLAARLAVAGFSSTSIHGTRANSTRRSLCSPMIYWKCFASMSNCTSVLPSIHDQKLSFKRTIELRRLTGRMYVTISSKADYDCYHCLLCLTRHGRKKRDANHTRAWADKPTKA